MSVFNSVNQSTRNSLYSLASVGGALLGIFLIGGAYGHFAAVWPAADDAIHVADKNRFALLLPGLVLVVTGLINVGLCRVLWTGVSWSVQLALFINLFASIYLAYLMSTDIPNHPIGLFLALVSSQGLLLCAIRFGLVWPATDSGPR